MRLLQSIMGKPPSERRKKSVNTVNNPSFAAPSTNPLLPAEIKEVQKFEKLVGKTQVEILRNEQRLYSGKKSSSMQRDKMQALINHSRKTLFKCQSVFPFDLFPDDLIIEPHQVNLKRKIFFYTSNLISIPITNISDVVVQTSPFFAAITIVDRSFVENSFTLSYLKRNDAKRARKIIQGLVIASKEDIDVGKIEPDVLASLAEKLGHMYEIRE